MAILTNSDYPEIRSAIDVALDGDDLSDTVIGYGIYGGTAELEVADRIPDAESRSGDDLTHVKAATVLITAALLSPSVPQLVSTKAGEDFQFQYNKRDWVKHAAELRQRAEGHIQAVLTPTGDAPQRPTMFVRMSGTRGK